MRPEDRRFVIPTWVQSFAEYAPWSKRTTLQKHWAVVERLLLSPSTRVVVLCTDSAQRTLHGWAAADVDAWALHYAYIPPELRGGGLARTAITSVLGTYADRIDVTHPWPELKIRNETGRVIGTRQHNRFRWSPYPLLSCEAA